jgi:hypothetical protein
MVMVKEKKLNMKDKLAATQLKLARAKACLLHIKANLLHEPDVDAMQYCACCHRSPYNKPPHTPECLVPHLAKIIQEIESE